MHKLLWKIWFASQKFGVSDVFATWGHWPYSSVAVQCNDLKLLFALFSSFQHTNILLGN